MKKSLHGDELPIDVDLVRRLIAAQFPRYAALQLTSLGASGSTNVLFRLGDDLLVRLPRQTGGSAAIDKESRWLPTIGSGLQVAVPEVVGLGEPAFGYGERWSILRWLEGQLPEAFGPDDAPAPARSTLAVDLTEVVLALRAIEVPPEAATDPALRSYRGGSLAGFDQQMRLNLRQCQTVEGLDLNLEAAMAVWEDALKLPGAREAGPDRWVHTDLVAENLLLTEGRLSAVLDFGGLAVGDPTIDLHGAWEVLDAPAREVFRARLAVSDAEWLRGRAWALGIALGALSYYWSKMPGRRRDRLAMARSVLADAGESGCLSGR